MQSPKGPFPYVKQGNGSARKTGVLIGVSVVGDKQKLFELYRIPWQCVTGASSEKEDLYHVVSHLQDPPYQVLLVTPSKVHGEVFINQLYIVYNAGFRTGLNVAVTDERNKREEERNQGQEEVHNQDEEEADPVDRSADQTELPPPTHIEGPNGSDTILQQECGETPGHRPPDLR